MGSDGGAEGAAQLAEGISRVRLVPFADVVSMIGSGEITDGETVAALMLAAVALGRVS